MDRLKNYMHDFWNDESGMELLQLAIVIVITVMNTVRNNISKANDNANDQMQGILNQANQDN